MEKDLDTLLLLAGDIANHGDYLPIALLSQNELRRDLQKDGMWGEDFKRLLIVNGQDEILGHLWIFKSAPYFDALEIGYTLFSERDRGKVPGFRSGRPPGRLSLRGDPGEPPGNPL